MNLCALGKYVLLSFGTCIINHHSKFAQEEKNNEMSIKCQPWQLFIKAIY